MFNVRFKLCLCFSHLITRIGTDGSRCTSVIWSTYPITIQKHIGSSRKGISLCIDRCYEQVNELIKGDGGTVGLTENPQAADRWMVAGPEISRVVLEFEKSFQANTMNNILVFKINLPKKYALWCLHLTTSETHS